MFAHHKSAVNMEYVCHRIMREVELDPNCQGVCGWVTPWIGFAGATEPLKVYVCTRGAPGNSVGSFLKVIESTHSYPRVIP